MNVFDLHPGSRIYLDANIYIYGFEGIVEQRDVITALFEEIERKQVTIIASLLLFPELLAKPLREGQTALANQYEEFLRHTDRVALTSVSDEIVLRSAGLRAQSGLKTADALHLATALEYGCDSFVSNDHGFSQREGIQIVRLNQL